MATPEEFSRRMDRQADQIRRGATRVKRTTALAVLQAVVMATPVGNPTLWSSPAPPGYVGGRARANWQVGLGGAVEGATDKIDPAGSGTIAAGSTRIQQSGDGQAIHLTNNVEYIIPLNNGHSAQAPAGFVETAIRAGTAHVKAQRILED